MRIALGVDRERQSRACNRDRRQEHPLLVGGRPGQTPGHAATGIDVLIVGAGFSGLSAGLFLARAGRTVAICDRMHPGEGASSRNGGVTSGTIRPDFATMSRHFGEESALAIEMEGKAAREFL